MTSKHEQEFKMIGLNIAYFRKLKGISQMKLAETIGISRTHMSNIEAPNMPTSVSLETLMDIADALDIPAYVLLSFHSDVEIDTPSVFSDSNDFHPQYASYFPDTFCLSVMMFLCYTTSIAIRFYFHKIIF